MNIERLKREDVRLKAKYNCLCADELLRLRNAELRAEIRAENENPELEFDSSFISKIMNSLRKLVGFAKPRAQSEADELRAERDTLRLKFGDDFVSEIRIFLERLAEEVKSYSQSPADFYWASNSYRMWLYLLLDRGILLADLPSTILGPSKEAEVFEIPEKASRPFTEDSSKLVRSAFGKVYDSMAGKSFG